MPVIVLGVKLPQGAYRHGAQLRPERQSRGAGVEHNADQKVIAELVSKPTQPVEVVWPDR